jgi:hypothetical protein
MALAFPSSPTVNQTYTSGTRTWTWNGTAWKLPSTALTGVTGTGNAVLSVGPTITLTNATALPLTTGVTGVLPAANGGTSLASPGTAGNILTSNGTTWTSATLANATGLPLTTGVTGVLPAANGGTSLSSPGTSGNILTSNGTTWTSATPVLASGTPTLVIVSATTQTAVAGNHYVLTNVAATTVTMPATVVAGDLIFITSGNGLATNVVAYSGSHKIMGLLENLTINTTAYITLQLRYINTTIGWVTL